MITKPATSAWSSGVEQRERAEERGEDAAAVDVADDEHRQVRPRARGPCSSGRAARRLISAGLPAPSQTTTSKRARRSASAPDHDRPQLVLELLVGARVGVRVRLAHHDTWLWRSPDGLIRTGSSPPRARARRPPPAPPARGRSRRRRGVTTELSAMFCALNGATRTPWRVQPAADPGGDHALAGVGVRAGDEERALHERPSRASAAPAATQRAAAAPTADARSRIARRDVRRRRAARPSPSSGRCSTGRRRRAGRRAARRARRRTRPPSARRSGWGARRRRAGRRASAARGEPPTSGAHSAASARASRARRASS